MARTIGIGQQDFADIRRDKLFYIDKTKLCAQTRASSLAGGMPVW